MKNPYITEKTYYVWATDPAGWPVKEELYNVLKVEGTENGKLVATFETDSYVFVKATDNSVWLLMLTDLLRNTLWKPKGFPSFVQSGIPDLTLSFLGYQIVHV